MRGQLLGGRYLLQSRLGEGGMAFVYIATDEKLGRKVAVKILHHHMAENPDLRQRFFNEAVAISKLDHPNILKIYDFSGETSEELYIVTELLKGQNLNDYTASFPGRWLHPIIAVCIVREILKALAKAHGENVIHRDIKPENIFVLTDGKIKLMDFGIAKDMRAHSMTITGTFMGSPSYMSPEQIRGKSVDNRSDLYSLGVLFYEIITGKLPYSGSSTHDVILKIVEGVYKEPKIHVPNLPDDLNSIINKAMTKNPATRYQEARTFARDLDIFLGKHGFEESHIELERYFSDHIRFEQRLRRLDFSNGATISIDGSNKVDTDFSNRVTKQKASEKKATIHTQVFPQGVQPSSTKYGWSAKPNASQQQQQLPVAQASRAVGQTAMHAPQHAPRPQPRQRRAVVRQAHHSLRYVPTIIFRKRGGDWLGTLVGAALVTFVGIMAIVGFMQLSEKISRNQKDAPPILQPTKPELANKPPPVSAQVAPEKKKPVQDEPKSKVAEKDVKPSTSNKKIREKWAENTNQNNKPAAQTNIQPKVAPANPATGKPAPVVIPPKKDVVEKPNDEQVNRKVEAVREKEKERLRNEEADEHEKEVEKEKGKEQERAASKPGQVKVSSRPAAEIFIDGKNHGTTVDRTTSSAWITLSGGSHTLELRRTGFQTYERQFSVKGGDQLVISGINLSADILYTLTLSSSHKPTKVLINNLSDSSRKNAVIGEGASTHTLSAGRYKIRFEYKGQVIERNLILSGDQKSQSVRVEFKGAK